MIAVLKKLMTLIMGSQIIPTYFFIAKHLHSFLMEIDYFPHHQTHAMLLIKGI